MRQNKGMNHVRYFYVPVGQIVRLENLHADRVEVDGTLVLAGQLKTRWLRGQGSVQARHMQITSAQIHSITCSGTLVAGRVLARRVYAQTAIVTRRIGCLVSLIAPNLVAPEAAAPLLGCERAQVRHCLILSQRHYTSAAFQRAVWRRRQLARLTAVTSGRWLRRRKSGPKMAQHPSDPSMQQMLRDAMLREKEAHEASIQADPSAERAA